MGISLFSSIYSLLTLSPFNLSCLALSLLLSFNGVANHMIIRVEKQVVEARTLTAKGLRENLISFGNYEKLALEVIF